MNQAKITVRIQPGARRNAVTGVKEGILQLKIAAPPVEGKANRELIEFLSELLDIPKSNIEIQKGLASKNKMVLIQGLTGEQVIKILEK